MVKKTKFNWWEDSVLDVKIEDNECNGYLEGMRGRGYDDVIISSNNKDYHTFFIKEIVITPEKKGCGKRFMKVFEKELKEKKVKTIYGDITEDAVGFFKKMGFKSATKPSRWTDTNWGKSLYMLKEIDDK